MQNEPLPTPQAVAELAARVAVLERSSRRWRWSFAALAVIVCGMGAAGEAVRDVEFGIVKAKSFQVVDSKGTMVGHLEIAKSKDNSGEYARLGVVSSDKQRATILIPGENPLIVDHGNK
jgi:malic enzyme